VATDNELDGRALAAEYRQGDTLEAIARRHSVSLWRVRSLLLAMDVELRPPGRRRAASMPRMMSRPMAAPLTGEAGGRRYAEAIARGAIPPVGELPPQQAGHCPPQWPIIRGPRAARKARMDAERKAFAALAADDDAIAAFQAAALAGLTGGLEDRSGNTRGVRRNPRTGAVERF
jgi:hypothetical protein